MTTFTENFLKGFDLFESLQRFNFTENHLLEEAVLNSIPEPAFSLREVNPGLLPEGLREFLSKFHLLHIEYYEHDDHIALFCVIGCEDLIRLSPVSIASLATIQIGTPAETDTLEIYPVTIKTGRRTLDIALHDFPIEILFQSTLIKKAVKDNNLGTYVKVNNDELFKVLIKSSISINQNLEFGLFSDVNFETTGQRSPVSFELDPFFIGDTGFVVEVENPSISPDINNLSFSASSASIIPPTGKEEGTLGINAALFSLLPKIGARDLLIDKNGVTGTFKAQWPLHFTATPAAGTKHIRYTGTVNQDADFFGLNAGLEYIEITVEKNKITKAGGKGKMFIPYFNTPVDISVSFDKDFKANIRIEALNEGLEIKKEGLIKLTLKSLDIQTQGDNPKFGLSGALEPLLFAAEGMKWPKLDVKDLFVDSKGKLSIKEAWMDMQGTAALDFYGFSGEIKKVGFGMEGDQMWFGFSGGMKLIDFLPIKGDVEECKFKWPEALDLGNPSTVINELKKIQVQFSGVNVDFEIPKTLSIKGSARLIKEPNKVGFGGDMVLDVPTAGFKAEAGLLVGMNFEMPAYAFFMTYFGFELAAGIPLGQSGLALKGALGMLGINVEPDRNPDQNWYADWYKRGPIPGAHQTNKWRDARNAFALGIGVTITSADGFVKGTRGLLVLAVPGPILILEGRALLLEGLPASNPKEPPLRALAIFDGKEQIAQFNIEAQAEIIAKTLDASGELEAFFDFKDITNWHIFLGIDEPKSRRIKANLLNVVRADAYLMFDMNENGGLRTRLGASTVVEPPIPSPKVNVLGQEIGIDIKARLSIDGKGEISMMPDQFSGALDIDGELGISALGLEASVIMEADMKASGPQPFSMSADFRAQLNLPDGLPDFAFEHNFKYTLPSVQRITLESPLAEVSLVNRFRTHAPTAAVRRLAEITNAAVEAPIAQFSPTAEMDSFPVLSFSRDMNHATGFNDAHFLRHPGANQVYRIGEVDVNPEIVSIQVFSKPKSKPFHSTAWTPEFSSAGTPRQLVGSWLLESDPAMAGRPPYKKLQLHTPNPLAMTMHSLETLGGLFGSTAAKAEHLSRRQLNEHSNFLFGPLLPAAEDPCIAFNTETPLSFIGGSGWSYAGMHVYSPQRFEVRDGCLRSTETITLAFDRPVKRIDLTLCSSAAFLDADFCQIPAPDDKGNYPKGSQPGLANPDFQYLCFATTPGIKAQNAEGTVFSLASTQPFQQITLRASFMEIARVCPVYDDIPPVIDPGYANIALPVSPETTRNLKPGSYYKIEITTRQRARVYSNRKLYLLYKQALGLSGTAETKEETYTQVAYFQTEGPPSNLESYIKHAYPEKGSIGFLNNTRSSLRFKRNYMQLLHNGVGAPEYGLSTALRGKDGECWHLPCGFSLQSNTTFFPDEANWEAELQRRGKSLGLPRDISLDIQTQRVGMEPGKAYTLLVGGGSGGEELAATGSGSADEVRHRFNCSDGINIGTGLGPNRHTGLEIGGNKPDLIVSSKRQDLSDIDLAFDFVPKSFGPNYFAIRLLESGNNRLELILRWNTVATAANVTKTTLNGSELRLIENGATTFRRTLSSILQFDLFKTGADQKNRIRVICFAGRLELHVNYTRIWLLDLCCGKLFSSNQLTSALGDFAFTIIGSTTASTALVPEGWALNANVDIFSGERLAMRGRIKTVGTNAVTVTRTEVLQVLSSNNWMLKTAPLLPDRIKGWSGGAGIISLIQNQGYTISNISLRRAASIEIPFTANRNKNLAELCAAPLKMQLTEGRIPASTLITDAMNGFRDYRILEQDLWEIEKDAEFKEAKQPGGLTGTEAIDAVRGRLAQQQSNAELRFRNLMDAVQPELLLLPPPAKAQAQLIKETGSNRLLGLWIHFADYMDAATISITRHGRSTQLGRFRINRVLRLLSATQSSILASNIIWKPDSSRVLILFNSPIAFTPETLSGFNFRMELDRILSHGDATANIPHRYDRQILTTFSATDAANLSLIL